MLQLGATFGSLHGAVLLGSPASEKRGAAEHRRGRGNTQNLHDVASERSVNDSSAGLLRVSMSAACKIMSDWIQQGAVQQ